MRWILITLALCLPYLPTTTLADTQPVKLGYLLDLSGKGAFIGVQSQAGAELAKRELNERGISVEIIYEDHRTEGRLGASGAHKLISINKVDALLCDLTPPCVAASPIAQSAEKLFAYQAPIISLVESNPFAFKNFLDYKEGCELIARRWHSLGIKSLWHFKVNAEFGELCLEGSRLVYPEQRLVEYDAGTDLRSIVTRMSRFTPEAVLQTGYEGDYINRLRVGADLKLRYINGMPQPLFTEAVVNAIPANNLLRTIVFGFPTLDHAFVDRLKEANLYRSDASLESAAIAYDHVVQLTEAILRCRGRDIHCQVKTLEQTGPGNSPLGFAGWKKRVASYPWKLRIWNGTKLVELPVDK